MHSCTIFLSATSVYRPYDFGITTHFDIRCNCWHGFISTIQSWNRRLNGRKAIIRWVHTITCWTSFAHSFLRPEFQTPDFLCMEQQSQLAFALSQYELIISDKPRLRHSATSNHLYDFGKMLNVLAFHAYHDLANHPERHRHPFTSEHYHEMNSPVFWMGYSSLKQVNLNTCNQFEWYFMCRTFLNGIDDQLH